VAPAAAVGWRLEALDKDEEGSRTRDEGRGTMEKPEVGGLRSEVGGKMGDHSARMREELEVRSQRTEVGKLK